MKTKISLLTIVIISASVLKVSAQYCGPYGSNRYEIQTTTTDPYLAFTIGSGTCTSSGSLTFPGMGINVTSPQYMLDILCDPSNSTRSDINVSTTNSVQNVGYRIGGNYVLWFNSSTSNIYVGVNAGNTSVNSYYNTFLGNNTGTSTTSGQGNVAVGFGALYVNNGGNSDYNVAVGYTTMQNNTSGTGNTANGAYALFSNW